MTERLSLSLSGSDSKKSACNAGDLVLIPGWRRSPGEGNGNLLQYPFLESSMERGAWQAVVHGVGESDRTEQDTHTHTHTHTQTHTQTQTHTHTALLLQFYNIVGFL